MEKYNVDSSNINSFEYDGEAALLNVEFKSGVRYQYQNVKPELFDELQKAESKGRFFGSNIRPNPHLYPFQRLEGKGPEDQEKKPRVDVKSVAREG